METVKFSRNEQTAKLIAAHYETPPLLYLHSFGCQQNVNDGEKIKGVLADLGYGLCDHPDNADLIVFNTCAVREHAEQRVLGNIGALKKIKETKPGVLIAICGCMVQQQHIVDKLKKSYPFVDIVFGVNCIDVFPQLLTEKLSTRKKFVQANIAREEMVEDIPVKRDSAFKAWLPIMYGCDNYCSYCIVPFVRGHERSRESSAIIAEFQELVKQGYKEITLLGQNVNSYGKKLDENIDFSDLLKKLDAIEGDYRIRFLTSHPKDASRRLIDTIAESKHICHNLHLPVQSGSDAILVQMNRKYTVSDYMALIDYAKRRIPDMMFSSDIIVGFPGESEADFEATLELVKQAQYIQLFTFIYSKRSGTKAATMLDKTPHSEKGARIAQIIQVQEEISQRLCNDMKNKVVKVLVEGEGREEGTLTARLDNNMTVEFLGEYPVGQFVSIRITGSRGAILKGELIN